MNITSTRHGCRQGLVGSVVSWSLVALVLTAVLVAPSHAGRESYDAASGTFNTVVSVRWDATQAELDAICNELQQASEILFDATDGQHQFGEVLIANDSGFSNAATHWIFRTGSGASAPSGNFGIIGQHSTLRRGVPPQARWPQVIIHEAAHLFYCVRDEYEGPVGSYTVSGGCPDGCAGASAICVGDGPTYECLMEGPDANDSEFCSAANHDPDRDTEQECDHGQSCWERIAAAGFGATAPTGLPNPTPPPNPLEIGCVFLPSDPRIVLVLDRSGSMFGQRLVDAQDAAKLVVDLAETGTQIGVVSFADGASPDYFLQPMDNNTDRTNARNAIDGISALGRTNYSAGLDEALTMFGEIGTEAINNVIFFSDGKNNEPQPDPDTALNTRLATLASENIPVHTVGIGDLLGTPEEARLEDMADQTGGEYFRSPIGSSAKTSPLAQRTDLPADYQVASGSQQKAPIGRFNNTDMRSHYARLWAASEDYSTMLETEQILDSNNPEACTRFFVDEFTDPVTIVCSWEFESEEGFAEVCLRTPSGQVFCPEDVANFESVDYRENSGSGYALYRVSGPLLEPGTWEICVQAFDGAQGSVALRCQAFGRSSEIWAHARMDRADVYGQPENPVVEVTPYFEAPITNIPPKDTPEKQAGSFDVTGLVLDPEGLPMYEFAFTDDGPYAGADRLRADGTWTGVIPNAVLEANGYKPGTYTVDIQIHQRGEAYTATNHAKPLPGDKHGEGQPAPEFERTYRTSFVYEPEFVITGTPEDFDPAVNPIRFVGSYPNPFTSNTTISFELVKPSEVEVSVYNVRGEKITTVYEGRVPAGRRTVQWSGRDDEGQVVASGIYFYRVRTPDHERTGRLVRVR